MFHQPGPTPRYAALCARMPYAGLIAAECLNLTGGEPEADGFALCSSVAQIPQAAYVRMGLALLAFGDTWPALLQAVAEADFAADGFRVDCLTLTDKDYHFPPSRSLALANVIPARPNLTQPRHRLLLVVRDRGLWLGEVVAECQHTYRRHDQKPHRTSTSLPSRLARALVNLVPSTARTLLDPCCGTGSILLEAQARGLQALGADVNQVAVEMARQNLAHFGYQAELALADIDSYVRCADALVTDLPYGRYMQMDQATLRRLLARGCALAPLGVYVAADDLTPTLLAAGYADVTVYPVEKHAGFARQVHLARRRP